MPMNVSLQHAADYLLDQSLTRVSFEGFRPPVEDDIPCFVADVVAFVSDPLREDPQFRGDEGGADLPPRPIEGKRLDDLDWGLRMYLRNHVDLSSAAWQPTGDVLTVYRDGGWAISVVADAGNVSNFLAEDQQGEAP